ncbi:MAG: TIGR03663 family protein [Vicinamibacterales bacterium]
MRPATAEPAGSRPRAWQGMAGWERLVWPCIRAAAACSRLWDLGARVMSHDESLHAFFSFRLLAEGTYRHEPVYHGPLLYHVNAFVYALLGASDATARLAPALAGILLVASMWLVRDLMGRRAAVAAAVLVTISPTLLFYSRHLRNDIYIACVTLLWAYAAFRYLDRPQARWRYLVAASMALGFITKEVSFISGAVIGSFIAGVAVMPTRGDEAAVRARAAMDLAILMLALVVPFASGPAFLAAGWPAVGAGAEAAASGLGRFIVLNLFAAALVAGGLRFGWRAWLATMGLFWGLQLVFFTTGFTNTRGGLVSGIVGSLGYWLTQQDVARGGQPWFYYGLLGLLYEFLPVLLGVLAAGVGAWRLRHHVWDPVDAAERPPTAVGPGRETRRLWLAFLVWWTAASWVAYAWASERMPWLLVHQVLPLCLLAGWGTRRLLAPLARRDARGPRWALIGAGVVALGAALTVRASVQASFRNIDRPVELLSYAQASPDVTGVVRRIAAIDERRGGGHQLAVALDDETFFPLRWYLRDYPNTITWRDDSARAASAPVVVAGLRNRAAWPLAGRGYVRQRGILLWWPLQGYLGLTASGLRALLADPVQRRNLWRIAAFRDYGLEPGRWPGNRQFDLYLRDDVAALAGQARAPGPATPRLRAGRDR